MRQEGEVVIPMIAFIEGGIRIPMGRVTRDYLIAHRLSPTQCTPNVFRILGSVDALNKKMGVNLTHHDVNWIYNHQYLKGQGYYLKTWVLSVRLISCLPNTNKGMDKDFLIVLGEWHTTRQEREVVIPMIAFIEGGMRIPIGRVTRDYLIDHMLP